MADLPEDLLYQGVSINITFASPLPTFGDLFLICGDQHPSFPPTGKLAFDSLAHLQFEQVDDYFGVRAIENEGDDVPIWLYPIVHADVVHHHPGPFDGIRLDYNILRNPIRRAEHYLKCVESFSQFAAQTTYRNRHRTLGLPPTLATVRNDIAGVVQHWAAKGIVVGSEESLLIDF